MTDEALNADPAAPVPDDEQMARRAGFGPRRRVEPGDVSGAELTNLAMTQALKFGR